jgi:hypothetical protein
LNEGLTHTIVGIYVFNRKASEAQQRFSATIFHGEPNKLGWCPVGFSYRSSSAPLTVAVHDGPERLPPTSTVNRYIARSVSATDCHRSGDAAIGMATTWITRSSLLEAKWSATALVFERAN